ARAVGLPVRARPAFAFAGRRFIATYVELGEKTKPCMSCHDFTAPVARLRSSTRVGCSGGVVPRPRSPCPGVVAGAGVSGGVPGGVVCGCAGGAAGGCAGGAGGFCPGVVVTCGGLVGDGGLGAPGGTAVSPGAGSPGVPGPPPRRPRPPRPPVGSTGYASHFASAEDARDEALATSVCCPDSSRTRCSTGFDSVWTTFVSEST